MTKKIFTLLLLFTVFSISAQNKKQIEKDIEKIKNSGAYYWGESAICKSSDRAKKMSLENMYKNIVSDIEVSLVDMGNRFRLICAKIELVKQPEEMPKLPVARLMWKLKPDFKTGAAAWIYAGGAHHAVVSTCLTVDDIRLFAKFTDTELVVIDENTDLVTFEQNLKMLDVIAK